MSLSRNTSAHDLLSQFTPDENAYFIACTDVFHDKQYNVIGRPSASSQLQNCVTLNLSRTFVCTDFGLPTTDNWDLNLISLPFITTQIMTSSSDYGFEVSPATGASPVAWGGITAFAAPSGTPVLPYTNSSRVKTLNANDALFPQYDGSAETPVQRVYYQILSIGYEAINATPELYRSGTVIRYRVPTQGRSVPLAVSEQETFAESFPIRARESVRCFPQPPFSSSLATQYPDSVLDEAVKGTYAMHTLQDQVSDFYMAGNDRVFFSAPSLTAVGAANSFISASIFQTGIDYDPPLVRGDFDMVGSYFTGLSPQSVIQIRYRIILSLVPSSSDSYLSSLAKMSPPENTKLDRLVSLVQNEFLPGIPVGMNPKGEWWRVVLNGVAKVAPKLGHELGGKPGKLIGQGAQQLLQQAAGKKPPKNKNKNKKQTQPLPAPKPISKAK